ncbi:MAG: DUF1499 domain-containing protein [Planctomycetota bacterium]|nr:DUF1499 domain-containing protein [Planctomycetota bacterium]
MIEIKNLQRGLTVNFARLDSALDDPMLHPVILPQLPEAIAEKIESWANDRSRWSVVSRQDTRDSHPRGPVQSSDEVIQIHLTRTTRLFRFVDDIRISLTREAAGTRVDATSQSRIGKGDLGQNPRNLKEFTQMLQRL